MTDVPPAEEETTQRSKHSFIMEGGVTRVNTAISREEMIYERYLQKIKRCTDPGQAWRTWFFLRNGELKGKLRPFLWSRIHDLCKPDDSIKRSDVGRVIGIPPNLTDLEVDNLFGEGTWKRVGRDITLKNMGRDEASLFLLERATEENPLDYFYPPLNGADDVAAVDGHVLVVGSITENDRESIKTLLTEIVGTEGSVLSGRFNERSGTKGNIAFVFQTRNAREKAYREIKSSRRKLGDGAYVRRGLREARHKAFLSNIPYTADEWSVEEALLDKGLTGITQLRLLREQKRPTGRAIVVFESKEDVALAESSYVRLFGRRLYWSIPEDTTFTVKPPQSKLKARRVMAQETLWSDIKGNASRVVSGEKPGEAVTPNNQVCGSGEQEMEHRLKRMMGEMEQRLLVELERRERLMEEREKRREAEVLALRAENERLRRELAAKRDTDAIVMELLGRLGIAAGSSTPLPISAAQAKETTSLAPAVSSSAQHKTAAEAQKPQKRTAKVLTLEEGNRFVAKMNQKQQVHATNSESEKTSDGDDGESEGSELRVVSEDIMEKVARVREIFSSWNKSKCTEFLKTHKRSIPRKADVETLRDACVRVYTDPPHS